MSGNDATPRIRPKRGPVTSAVHALGEAAHKASRAGMTLDEFVAAAVWAANMSDLPIPHPSITGVALDRNWVRNEWHVVEAKMGEEQQL